MTQKTCFLIFFLFSMTTQALSKPEVMEQLRLWQKQNTEQISMTDEQIRLTLQEVGGEKITDPEKRQQLGELSQKLNDLKKSRLEFIKQNQLIDQTIFQVETKYTGDDLKTFLQQRYLEMALIESKSLSADTQLSTFYTYLSIALRDLPEPGENPLAFLKGYVKFSSVSHPKNPNEFLAQRNFTNGVQNEKAHPVSLEDVGEIVEQKLQSQETTQTIITQ